MLHTNFNGEIMFSAKLGTPISPKISNTSAAISTKNNIPAFKYNVVLNDQRFTRTIEEYFIPSANICFNNAGAFKSNKARNIEYDSFRAIDENGKLEKRKVINVDPLIGVQLSETLVEQMKKVANLREEEKQELAKLKFHPDNPFLEQKSPGLEDLEIDSEDEHNSPQPERKKPM